MPREASITYESVAAVAEAMVCVGGRPTARSVRDEIGTGSMATVLRHLQRWREVSAGQGDDAAATLPLLVVQAINLHLESAVKAATTKERERYALLRSEMDAVVADGERLATRITASEAAAAGLRVENATLTGKLQQVSSDLRERNAETKVLRKTLTEREKALAVATANLLSAEAARDRAQQQADDASKLLTKALAARRKVQPKVAKS